MENGIDGSSVDVQWLRCLAQLPNLLQQARMVLGGRFMDCTVALNLRQNIRDLRKTFRPTRDALCERLTALSEPFAQATIPPQLASIHAHFGRGACLALATGIIIDCLLATLEEGNAKTELLGEAAQQSLEICSLVPKVSCHRPLGTLYMSFALKMAYVGAIHPDTKAWIVSQLIEFSGDTFGPGSRFNKSELDWLARYLTLQDVSQCEV